MFDSLSIRLKIVLLSGLCLLGVVALIVGMQPLLTAALAGALTVILWKQTGSALYEIEIDVDPSLFDARVIKSAISSSLNQTLVRVLKSTKVEMG